MDRCTRGDRCKFSHGDEDSDEKKARLEKERDLAKVDKLDHSILLLFHLTSLRGFPKNER